MAVEPPTPEQIGEWVEACRTFPQRFACGTEQQPLIVASWLWGAMDQLDDPTLNHLRSDGHIVRTQPLR